MVCFPGLCCGRTSSLSSPGGLKQLSVRAWTVSLSFSLVSRLGLCNLAEAVRTVSF